MSQDPDFFRFQQYAEGNTAESPVDLSGREGAPHCSYCNAAIDEDEGCQDVDCLAERDTAEFPDAMAEEFARADERDNFED